MKTRVRTTAVIAAALLVAACSGRQTQVAEQPLTRVHGQLIAMPAQANAMDTAMQAAGTAYWIESGGNPIVWRFAMNGKAYCRFHAELTEKGPTSTVVATWAEQVDEASRAAVEDGRKRPDYRYLCDVARIAGEESVAAAVQNRAADKPAIVAKLRGKVASDPASAMRAADAAMDAATPKWEDPCAKDVASKRCQDWRSLQRVREQQRNQAPPPTGTFQMR